MKKPSTHDKKLALRHETIRHLDANRLQHVRGGAQVGDDGGSGSYGGEAAMVFPICTNTQIGMDRQSCTSDILGVVFA